jgi:hypothetical protein
VGSPLKSLSLLRLAQIAVIAAALALGITTSLATPLLKGRDELAHFQFIQFIAQHKRLPLNLAERNEAGYKSGWPPLFYTLIGLAGSGIRLDSPPFLKTAQDNPRIQLVFGPEGIGKISSLAIPTEDPYRGEILLFYLTRWLTVICAVMVIGLTFWLIEVTQPGAPWLALSGAAFLAFIPVATQVSGVISYEPLLGIWTVLYFLLLFQTVQNPRQSRYYLGLGLLLGLAMLTKYTPIPAVAVVPFLLIWCTFRERWGWFTALRHLALFGLGLMLTFGSWLLYMEIYFNQVAELGWLSGLFYPFITGDFAVGDKATQHFASLLTSGELGQISPDVGNNSFLQWLMALLDDVWTTPWLVWIFLGLSGLALTGLARQWPGMGQRQRLWLLLVIVHIGLFMVLPVLRFWLTGDVNINIAAGQHVIFLIGPAVVLLLVYGLRAYLSPAHLAGIIFIVAALSLGQSLSLVGRLYTPAWPIQTVPLAKTEQVRVSFDSLSLLDYNLTAAPILQVGLSWRAETFMNEDYRVEITLLDHDRQAQARWLGQPLNGRYPTRAWFPGDRVRDLIQLPIPHLEPGSYQVQLRVLGEKGAITPITDTTASPDYLFSPEQESYILGSIPVEPANPAILPTRAGANPPTEEWSTLRVRCGTAPARPASASEDASLLE